VKLKGILGTASNELIGLAGRWWQEERKCRDVLPRPQRQEDGGSLNPNDLLYFLRWDIVDATSLTGLY
jgi:hypothetical protein